jgi:superfamily II DNA or RNA helicase
MIELPTDKLFPYQVEASKDLLGVLASRNSALDGSDTGTGKTYVAAAICKALDKSTLAIVPKIACTSWERAAEHCETELDVYGWEKIRTGKTPFGWWDHPPEGIPARKKCRNCFEVNPESDTCRINVNGHDFQNLARKHNYGRFNWHPNLEFIIFDEVHRANAVKSLNADMLIAAKRQNITTLALSATPAVSPLHFRALGYLLDMHKLTGDSGFDRWAAHYGVHYDMMFKGLAWKQTPAVQRKQMAQLNGILFPARGVRVKTTDIPGFPERKIIADLLDLGCAAKIEKLYAKMREAMETLHHIKEGDIDPENPLTKLLRARQEVELLKVPAVVEMAQDYIAKGYAVSIFVNFTATLQEFKKRLKTDCYVDGTQTKKGERQKQIDRFQANKAMAIIVQNQAGGVACSLQDINGDFPCVGLVMPSVSAIIMRQIFGRLHRQLGKSLALYRVIFAAGTKEIDIHKKVSASLNNGDALMDDDMLPDNLIFDKTQ